MRAAEDIVKGKSTPKPKPKKKKIRKSIAAVRSLENELITLLGTKVRISYKGDEGTIEIQYFSNDDFERVMDLLRTIK